MIWIFYIEEVYLVIAQLLLAGKDASSYLLFTRSPGPVTKTRTSRWHRDGLILAVLYWIPCAVGTFLVGPQLPWITGAAVLIRLSLYDIAFNKWSGLPITLFGTTPSSDRFFTSIFGTNGALTKSIVFLILLIALNVLKFYL